MKQLLLIIAVSFCFIASAQYTPTGSKTRFVNGIGLGSKLDAAFGTADSLVLYTKLDSTLMFKYKGTARALAYASQLSDYVTISGTQTITGAKTFSAVLAATLRLNVGGAGDNASYALNVNGDGNFSGSTSMSGIILPSVGYLSATATGPSGFSNSLVTYSNSGYGNLLGVDNQFSTKYFGIKTNGDFVHAGGNASFLSGSVTGNGLNTALGYSINANTGSLAISPSSTRGVINLGGTTDNFLTFANKGYIGVGSNYMQILGQAGVDLSFVSDATTVLSFAPTSHSANLTSRLNVNGATDNASYALNVNGVVEAKGGNFRFATTHEYAVSGENTADGVGARIGASPNGYPAIEGYLTGSLNPYFLLINPRGEFVTFGATPGVGTNKIFAGAANFSGVVDAASRLNVNGATDNASYALNVTGVGRFSGAVQANNLYSVSGNAIEFRGDNNSDIIANLSTSGATLPASLQIGSATYAYRFPRLTVRSDGDDDRSIVINNQSNTSNARANYILAAYGNSWVIGMGSNTSTYGNDLGFFLDATSSLTPTLLLKTDNTISTKSRLNVNGAADNSNVALNVEGGIKAKGYTVATLPTGVTGLTAYVTDALAPTYLAVVVGGGAVVCPVFYNGTNWVSH